MDRELDIDSDIDIDIDSDSTSIISPEAMHEGTSILSIYLSKL
jgi:hypothetical protein